VFLFILIAVAQLWSFYSLVAGRQKSAGASCIETKDGTIIIEQEEMLQWWKEYIGELFADSRGQRPVSQKRGGNDIMEEEIKRH